MIFQEIADQKIDFKLWSLIEEDSKTISKLDSKDDDSEVVYVIKKTNSKLHQIKKVHDDDP